MSLTFTVLLGYVGVAFLLLAYFLLVVGQLKSIDMHYIMLNLIGGFLVMMTLFTGGTVPMFQTIVAWVFISIYSFYKHHMTTTT